MKWIPRLAAPVRRTNKENSEQSPAQRAACFKVQRERSLITSSHTCISWIQPCFPSESGVFTVPADFSPLKIISSWVLLCYPILRKTYSKVENLDKIHNKLYHLKYILDF